MLPTFRPSVCSTRSRPKKPRGGGAPGRVLNLLPKKPVDPAAGRASSAPRPGEPFPSPLRPNTSISRLRLVDGRGVCAHPNGRGEMRHEIDSRIRANRRRGRGDCSRPPRTFIRHSVGILSRDRHSLRSIRAKEEEKEGLDPASLAGTRRLSRIFQ